jgi:hypothetical protein
MTMNAKPFPTDAELIRLTASDAPAGKPFGWANEQERSAIRAELIAGGMDPEGIRLIFAISREQERRAANRLTTRQRQDLARWLGLKWVSPHPSMRPPSLPLDAAELAYLAERLAGTNDPAGASILAKVNAALSRFADQEKR